jgi:hypothetical protein
MFKKHLIGFIRNPAHDERRVQPKRMIDTYAHRSVMQQRLLSLVTMIVHA